MQPSTNSYMMRLGDFKFSVSSASFDKINTQTEYRWAPVDVPTKEGTPPMQYNGQGIQSMTIAGTIFPQLIKNGLGQVDKMREQAAQGKAFTLCNVASAGDSAGVGLILGTWCIERISEDRTLFTPAGSPREIQFTMELKALDLSQGNK